MYVGLSGLSSLRALARGGRIRYEIERDGKGAQNSPSLAC